MENATYSDGIEKYRVAVAQLDSGIDRASNFEKIESMTAEASNNGAKLICFPEMVNILSKKLTCLERAESLDGESVSFFKALARKYNIHIACGTILETIPESKKVYNTCVLLDNEGNIVSVYRKRHTFDITMKDGREFRESSEVMPGEEIVNVDTALGKIGFGICYDLRFPEQYRRMSMEGMQILIIPASFTKETGQAHWETLLRARAIENGCYILASNQCGDNSGYDSYGHSMIIDPWGEILAKASYDETVLLADIDISYVNQVRDLIPSTQTL